MKFFGRTLGFGMDLRTYSQGQKASFGILLSLIGRVFEVVEDPLVRRDTMRRLFGVILVFCVVALIFLSSLCTMEVFFDPHADSSVLQEVQRQDGVRSARFLKKADFGSFLDQEDSPLALPPILQLRVAPSKVQTLYATLMEYEGVDYVFFSSEDQKRVGTYQLYLFVFFLLTLAVFIYLGKSPRGRQCVVTLILFLCLCSSPKGYAQEVTAHRQRILSTQGELQKKEVGREEVKDSYRELRETYERIGTHLKSLGQQEQDTRERIAEEEAQRTQLCLLFAELEQTQGEKIALIREQEVALEEAYAQTEKVAGLFFRRQRALANYLVYQASRVYGESISGLNKIEGEYLAQKALLVLMEKNQASRKEELRVLTEEIRKEELRREKLYGELKQKDALRRTLEQEHEVLRGELKVLEQEMKEKVRGSSFPFEPQKSLLLPLEPPLRMTSDYGSRMHPVFQDVRFHTGVDFAAPMGSPIYASAGGLVTLAGMAGGYGLTVMVDHGGGFSTLYAHASEVLVFPYQEVKTGDLLGYVGSTGISTGPHLHFEVREQGQHVNPLLWLPQKF